MIKNFTPRLYQQTILGTAAHKNTLVVLPTGLGKTAVAFLLAAQRLHQYPNSKILMLAPTKPLCEQHVDIFITHLDIPKEKIVLFTGSVKPEKRAEMWKEAQVIISTPQGLENDCINRRINLKEVSLMVFDECITKGTGINLANGKKTNVEDLEKTIEKKDVFVETLNENTGNYEPRKIIKFHKIRSNKEIIEICCGKRKIKTTSDHLFFSKTNGKIDWVPAKNLKTGSELALINFKTDNSRRAILIDKKKILNQFSHSQQSFFHQYIKVINIREKYGYGSRKISKMINIKEGTIRNWINKPYRKPIAYQLIETLEKENLLPIYSDNAHIFLFARLIGHLYGDGWAYKDKNSNLVLGFSGKKNDLMTIQNELSLLKSKYSNIHSRETISEVNSISNGKKIIKGISNSFLVTDRKLTKLLLALGVPVGNKTNNIFLVPKWIINGSKKVKREFLSSLMGSEGYIPKLKLNEKTCNPVRLSFNVVQEIEDQGKKYALQLKKLFSNFDIVVSISRQNGNIRKDGIRTIKYLLTISNSNKNMINFLSQINYTYSKRKRVQANKVLSYLLSKKSNLKDRIKQYDGTLDLHKQGLGSHKISKLLGLDRGTIENWIYHKRKPTMITASMRKINKLEEDDFYSTRWSIITKIKNHKKEEYVYDLTIDKNHNYMANNFLVHNCHHATGEYAYVWIAQQYDQIASFSRILALTASPGSDLEKVKEVCDNLKIEKVEVRTEKDPDVKPYIQSIKKKWIEVEFPDEFKKIQKYLQDSRKAKLIEAQKHGYCNGQDLTKTALLALQGELQKNISSGHKDFEILRSISLIAEALKIDHSLELLETQGIKPLHLYFKKMQNEALTSKVKALKNLMYDIKFKAAMFLTEELADKSIKHPKLLKLKELVFETLQNNQDAKIIIFTQFRDSADEIAKELNKLNIKNQIFFGQAKKNGVGFSQKQQKEILDRFRIGEFNILIATSVAEEGLDIPKVDEVIFYEPIPSAIRSIQRRGRTGRLEKGEVTILVTLGTRDEAYRWSAHHKEKRMYRNLEKLKKDFTLIQQDSQKDTSLHQYISKDQVVAVLADHREKSNKIIKELIDLGVSVKTAQLTSADYVVSGKVGVELKKVPDFVASIIDGRLLSQVKDLKNNFQKAVLIIEGEEDIYALRKVHANAIRGMLASIVLDFQVPILYTKNPKDTASLLAVMAKREQGKDSDFTFHASKPRSLKEQQEFIVSSFPNIGVQTAQTLLEHFGSIKNLINATKEEIKEIKGVGEKTAQSLVKMFEERYTMDYDKEHYKDYNEKKD